MTIFITSYFKYCHVGQTTRVCCSTPKNVFKAPSPNPQQLGNPFVQLAFPTSFLKRHLLSLPAKKNCTSALFQHTNIKPHRRHQNASALSDGAGVSLAASPLQVQPGRAQLSNSGPDVCVKERSSLVGLSLVEVNGVNTICDAVTIGTRCYTPTPPTRLRELPPKLYVHRTKCMGCVIYSQTRTGTGTEPKSTYFVPISNESCLSPLFVGTHLHETMCLPWSVM